MSKTLDQEKELSFVEHLEVLRWHLIRGVASIGVFAIVAFLSKSIIFHHIVLAPSRIDFPTYKLLCKMGYWLQKPEVLCIEELPFILQNRVMTGQFTMHILASVVIGLILAFPYFFWEVWRFIKPGLHKKEQSASRGAVFSVSFLFISGILFGYYIISPLSINFLSNYSIDPSIQNEIDITSFVSTIAMIVLACGIMFQLPVVMYFLTKAGLAGPSSLRSFRKMAIVIILIVSAILTPPDVVSQILIAMPLFLLYELGIFISWMVVRKERKRELKKDGN
ncbi:twin-arginine translocase subunit TatC [Hyphobacterium sp. CCMP332]|nr:twin-arginine translocase subunit TatC [Hyphobacterium sp. CCMP332]